MANQNSKSGLQQAADAAAAAKKLMEAVKAVTEGLATGNWVSLVKLLLPVIIFIVLAFFLFTVMFATSLFVPIADGKTVFDSPETLISDDFKQSIISAVTDAYSRANKKVIDEINTNYSSAATSYDQTSINIVNPLENSIPEQEIYKTYAMFTVYKDRMFAIEHAKNPNMKMEDDSKLYNIDDLKDMMSGKYNLLLNYTVSKNAWTYQPTKWDAAKKAYVNDGSPVSYCKFTYTITVADIDTVGPAIFDLQNLTNSADPTIPEEARIDEIEMARAKAMSIAAIFDSADEYGGDMEMAGSGATGQSTYTLKADYSEFISKFPVSNVNFDLNSKMSVPLGSSYHLSSSFGPRIHPIKKVLKFHTGVDLGSAAGVDIYSLANGVVVKTGFNDGYGNFVIVYHGEISGSYYFSTYNHMKEPASVSVGQVVTNSTIIGKVGSTGLSTGPHLHFEVRAGTKSNGSFSFVFKNPAEFLILAQ